MIRRLAIVVCATALLGAAPQPGASGEPRARAWALRIALATPAGELIAVADVDAESGADPVASGSPLMLAGQDPNRVTADLGDPDVESVLHELDDPTNSMTMEAGFAQAHVTRSASTASAGFTTMSGSGFAMASELFTFEQQEQMLTLWADTMDQIFGPLNDQLAGLGGLLGGAGIELPRLRGIAPEGLIDVARARQVASQASTSSSPGFSSARADTSLGEVRLFGGFIELRGVSAEAVSESVAGDDTREATARVGSMSIAGIEVVADDEGFRVAGNDLASAAVLQPALDLLLDALAETGLSITAVGDDARGDLRQASALEVSLTSPQGTMLISVAHAEASAASVGAPKDPARPASPRQVEEPETRVLGRGFTPGGGAGGPTVGPPPPPGTTVTQASGPIFRRPGAAEARAFRTVYLLVILAAIGAALILPMSLRRARRAGRSPLEGAFR